MSKLRAEATEFIVPVYYLPYLFYGECSYLTLDELVIIQRFEKDLTQVGFGHWSTDFDPESFFSSENDIDRFAGDCVRLEYVLLKPIKNLRDSKGRFTSTKEEYSGVNPEMVTHTLKQSVSESDPNVQDGFLDIDMAVFSRAGMSLYDVQIFLSQSEEGKRLLHPAEYV